MKILLFHLSGVFATLILTLFLGLIGFIIGLFIWSISTWIVQKHQDREIMQENIKEYLND